MEYEFDCEHDLNTGECMDDIPCDLICMVEDCSMTGSFLMPGELVFGSKDGHLLERVSSSSGEIQDLIQRGGWDTYVCAKHWCFPAPKDDATSIGKIVGE